MEKSKKTKEQFDALYAEWEKVIQDPKIQISSRPQDYTDNEPYRKIVKLGKDALPFILEKMENGVFFMNEAALKITGTTVDNIIEEEKKKPAKARVEFLAEKIPGFLSEQQKSKLILKSIQGK
ncbi:MAG: hypothetical protein WA102_08355 [Candidatus Methanoperedens sp.]